MRKLFSFAIVFALVTNALFFSSCNKSGATEGYLIDTTVAYPTQGLEAATLAEILAVPVIDTSLVPVLGRTTQVPSSYELDVPPPFIKQVYGSCYGWAVGYGLVGYITHITEGSPAYAEDQYFSPSYITSNVSVLYPGSLNYTIIKAMDVIKQYGCCKWSLMPETSTPPGQPPTPAALENASQYKVKDYSRIETLDLQLIKFFISNRTYALPFACYVDKKFEYVHSSNWTKRSGDRWVWKNSFPSPASW